MTRTTRDASHELNMSFFSLSLLRSRSFSRGSTPMLTAALLCLRSRGEEHQMSYPYLRAQSTSNAYPRIHMRTCLMQMSFLPASFSRKRSSATFIKVISFARLARERERDRERFQYPQCGACALREYFMNAERLHVLYVLFLRSFYMRLRNWGSLFVIGTAGISDNRVRSK